MSNLAVTKDGKAVIADEYSEEEWDALKSNYAVGDFFMPCCKANAIPKTSSNFLKFFAHYSDECSTSPESIWHLRAKIDICSTVRSKGVTVELEYTENSSSGKWVADVYFEYRGRRIAIEIQKSYQPLSTYLKRQEKYRKSGVESYWLLYKPRYMTLIKSLGKHRIKNEYGGIFPPEGYIGPCLPELPIAYYDTEISLPTVKGAGFLECSIDEWVSAILFNEFICVDHVWKIA